MNENLQDGGQGAASEPTPVAEGRSGPWGLWATMGFSLVIVVGYVLVQAALVVVAVIVAASRTKDFDIDQFAHDLTVSGLFWSLAVCAGAPVITGLTVLFAVAAKGIALRDYLAVHWRGWKVLGAWCLMVLLFIAFADSVTYLLRGRLVPPLLETVYETAYFVPLLWVAFILVAPLAEEVFFRGFFFAGVADSRLGPAGAVVLSSLLWAALHLQYDLYGMAMIFLGGLLLGYARWQSRTVYVPFAMHVVQNLLATVEVAVSL